jgi:hypothetical protein
LYEFSILSNFVLKKYLYQKIKTMKTFKYSILHFLLFIVAFSCNKSAEIAPAKAELFKTEASTGIGAEINTTITANGGTATIGSAGAKIVVPAGAMPVGVVFTTQAIDKFDNEGQGISIAGNWTKPITVEFAVPAGEVNPQNYKIALRLNNGYWITCTKPKYNASTRIVSVRIAPTSTVGAKAGAKILAKKYDLAFAKTFYIKPEKSVLDLGEKVTLKAYAREGFVPVKIGKRRFDVEADFDAAINAFAELSERLLNDDDDDEVIPLTREANPTNDDDEVVFLIVLAKEYEFTNNKTGFNRSWLLMDGPGSVDKKGNAGAEYTAPTDTKAKGKTAQISFLSRNNATKQDVEAKATIRIKDGLTRYTGTITSYYERSYGTKPVYTEIISSKSTATFVNSLGTPKRYETKYYIGTQPTQNLTTTVDEYSVLVSDGSGYRKLSGSCTGSGNDAGFLVMYINPDNTMELSGWLNVETNKCMIETYCDNCSPKYGTDNTAFYTRLDNPAKIKMTYSDSKIMAGTFTQKETIGDQKISIKINWQLTRED